MELLLSRPTLPALYARLPALWHRGTVVTGLARVSAQLGCFNTVRDELASAATQGAVHACLALVEHD